MLLAPSHRRKKGRYCSVQCSKKKRLCQLDKCRKTLTGKQRQFCSGKCKQSVYDSKKKSVQCQISVTNAGPSKVFCQRDQCWKSLTSRQRMFCSRKCKQKPCDDPNRSSQHPTSSTHDRGSQDVCQLEKCRKALTGKQTKFCSDDCKHKLYRARKTPVRLQQHTTVAALNSLDCLSQQSRFDP